MKHGANTHNHATRLRDHADLITRALDEGILQLGQYYRIATLQRLIGIRPQSMERLMFVLAERQSHYRLRKGEGHGRYYFIRKAEKPTT